MDHELGHYIWNTVENNTYMNWTEEDYLNFVQASDTDQERWRRIGGKSYESPGDWSDPLGFSGNFFSVNLERSRDYPKRFFNAANISGSCTTTIGVRFWFEFSQRLGDREGLEPGQKTPFAPVVANPIRIPAPDDWRGEVEEYARSFEGGEITRIKSAVFDERFEEAMGTTEATMVNEYNDYHVKIPGIETKDEFRTVWNGAQALTDRVVRAYR